MTVLDSIPSEILEHIAFYAATDSFLGPPNHLVPLLTSNRQIHSQLSISSNPLLYARIFAHKFDLQPVLRHLNVDNAPSTALAAELKLRFLYLKRIRAGGDAYRIEGSNKSCASLHQLLLRVFIWLLENEEKNERQLREYANIDTWLQDYWFSSDGASDAIRRIREGHWPISDRNASLAMWLYWFLLRPDDNAPDDSALDVLRAFAIVAHRYNITASPWTEFSPTSSPDTPSHIAHFDEDFQLTPLPAAIPAILAFLTLANKRQSNGPPSHPSISYKSIVRGKPSCEWDCEWARCLSISLMQYGSMLTGAFRPGSIEGIWEGQFTYTEFAAYAALLGGAPPLILQKSLVAAHQQTWKLREYHLMRPAVPGTDLQLDANAEPLPSGNPLRSYFPDGTHIKEDSEGLVVLAPNRNHSVRYQRSSHTTPENLKRRCENNIVDVIIMGEGHSSWGQFNLVGRVRPCDGFISLSKEYIDGDRGKWLYRGYLVGNVHGNLVGRWRDTLSPIEVSGYEGCFAMNRRR
ncbi:hypothetical protein AGABI2DRAFT_210129 [Agaricus bisporus var. bisporus H97]|uniref:hypothetical protein n=1 Tax=Agaricus bisporus var. bisporus (strain H97 / ATCC MYA-4626 / FGSC 10389) TaxID=936046 RepID=UPI00029F5D22|nr:hypothetical protein AGABI2DRAFT_210129 [Agaricus bisporus var. bisporus H97]EKV43438.1 hypothetical protein AGABI2DRAFT_210129 [Agaricus bisporus var. bisporus H97]